MATASQPRATTFNRVDADRRVRHPLHIIRGYIRRYVLLEGAAVTVLYVALCYWIGLGVDYLPWKLFSFDWLWTANEISGPAATIVVRLMVLLALVAGLVSLVAFKVVRRIFKEFNDAAVALLLERRYPRQLGDRLITAVELADPKLSQKYGYSQEMVDHTIRDAAERVESLPVYQIFRWKRLWSLWTAAVGITVGLYLLVAVGWCLFTWSSPLTFLVRFHQTSTIWAERNLLMQQSYWPPTHYIELVRFRGTEWGVPRDEDRPDVKVRWVRWTLAERSADAPRGWRPLYVRDLETMCPDEYKALGMPVHFDGWLIDLDDLDVDRVGPGDIPPEWGWQGQTSGFIRAELAKDEDRDAHGKALLKRPVKDAVKESLDWHNWTVDKLELQLNATDAKASQKTKEGIAAGGTIHALLASYREKPVANYLQATRPEDYKALQTLFSKLNQLADAPTMARTLRRMEEPQNVIAQRRSKSGSGTTNCKQIDNRKYLFPLSDLKESTKFSITADTDYATPWRDITLVPPPMIDQLQMDKEEPAYLHYRLLADNIRDAKDPAEKRMLEEQQKKQQAAFDAALKGKRQNIRGINLSTTGNSTAIQVPYGTTVTLTAHTDRKLHKEKLVRITPPTKRTEVNSLTPTAAVQLSDDQKTFTVTLANVTRMLEFEFEYFDEDGVRGSRRVVIEAKRDNVPKIENLALGVVPREVTTGSQGGIGGKYYVITPDAYILWRGTISDDHGLSNLQFKYDLEELPYQYLYGDPDKKDDTKKPDDPKKDDRDKRSEVEGVKLVLQGFDVLGGPGAYPFYAASYYGGLQNVLTEQVKPKNIRPTTYVVMKAWKRNFGTKFMEDATPEELDRLLKIQPSNRKLLLDIMNFTAERQFFEKFAEEQLKEANIVHSFIGEAADFAGVAPASLERTQLMELASSDPAEAVARIMRKLAPTPEDRDANKRLLAKPVEKLLNKRYELVNEDAYKGFDIQEHVIGIKTTDQKHFSLKLAVVATDNNLLREPKESAEQTAALPFLIVSENELLALMMADQRRYGELLFKSVAELEQTRQRFDTQAGTYGKSTDRPVDFLLRGDAVRKTLRDANLQAKLIHSKYVALHKEMKFNRMKETRIQILKENVEDKLAALLDPKTGRFVRCEDLLNKFYKEMSPDADAWEKADQARQSDDPALKKRLDDNKKKHLENFDKANTELIQLVKDLNAIVDAMRDLVSTDELIETLTLIEAQQRQLVQTFQVYEKAIRDWTIKQLGGQ